MHNEGEKHTAVAEQVENNMPLGALTRLNSEFSATLSRFFTAGEQQVLTSKNYSI